MQSDLIPYRVESVFDIVLDVESYPEFLPWCKSLRIVERGDSIIVADTVIQFKGFLESYRSDIKYGQDNGEYFIKVTSSTGPFKYLCNNWYFRDAGEVTEVEFDIDFEFNSILITKIMGVFFKQALLKIIDAFHKRIIYVSSSRMIS
jgi:coenzyme Q-binding protein COQ10